MAKNGAESAAETTKQIITLATGMLGLTVTFAKEFKPANTDLSVPQSLEIAWLFYGITILFGIWTLMAITGSINKAALKDKTPDAQTSNIQIPAVLMVLAFLVAIGLTIWAGTFIVR